MLAIFKREIKTYFTSAIGFIFLAVYYAFASIFFVLTTIGNSTSSMSEMFSNLTVIFIFLIPILTMRLMCEEKKQKTDQLLLTSPVSLFNIVFGKFLSALVVYAIGLSITIIFAFILALFVNIEIWVIIGNIVGMLLMGSALISIGLFISNLTENQMIAAVASFFIMLMLYLIDSMTSIVSNQILSTLLKSISIYSRYNNFSLGIFNFGDALFYFSLAAVFMFLTVRMLEKRRWG